MSRDSYFEKHNLSPVFLGHELGVLRDKIASQGDEFLKRQGLSFPSRLCSTLIVIKENQPVTSAEIGRLLDIVHQHVTQRVNRLIDLGLVYRQVNRQDSRQKDLLLTPEGETQVRQMYRCLELIRQSYEQWFEELDVDLSSAVRRALESLESVTIEERADRFNQPEES